MKKGDIVKLKSGGPKMTILKGGPLNDAMREGNRTYLCIWFAGGVLFDRYFEEQVIELIK